MINKSNRKRLVDQDYAIEDIVKKALTHIVSAFFISIKYDKMKKIIKNWNFFDFHLFVYMKAGVRYGEWFRYKIV